MSDVLKAKAWEDLALAAKAFAAAAPGEKAAGQRLSDAAKAWAKAAAPQSGEVRGTGGRTLRSGKVIPFGRSKNVPIEEATTQDLQWVAGALKSSIEDPAKERWAADNRALLDAIENELETR